MTTTIEQPELVMHEEPGGPDGHTPGADTAHDDHAHHVGPVDAGEGRHQDVARQCAGRR